jgi:putative membrane protein
MHWAVSHEASLDYNGRYEHCCSGRRRVRFTSRSPAQGNPNHPEAPWEMMHDWGWGSGWMWLMPLFGIAWFALLVVVIVLVVRWLGGGNGDRGASARSARDILDERYARGEIDREEYLQRRNDIAGG